MAEFADYIDVSKWQGAIDWAKLAAEYTAGRIGGVIMRAGYGGGTVDQCFEAYYKAATGAGIPVGAYWYAYWGNYTPTQEAKAFLAAVSGKTLNLGVWYDVEYERSITSLDKTTRTNKVLEALKVLDASGRYCGLYASTDMVNNRLEYTRLAAYDLWVAQYAAKCTCKYKHGIWQYTSTAKVPGIKGNVDKDAVYKDYPHFVTGILATGETTEAAPAAQAENHAPRKTYTLSTSMATGGDLRTLMDKAAALGLYVTGELTIGPMTDGDRDAMARLLGELAITFKEV